PNFFPAANTSAACLDEKEAVHLRISTSSSGNVVAIHSSASMRSDMEPPRSSILPATLIKRASPKVAITSSSLTFLNDSVFMRRSLASGVGQMPGNQRSFPRKNHRLFGESGNESARLENLRHAFFEHFDVVRHALAMSDFPQPTKKIVQIFKEK